MSKFYPIEEGRLLDLEGYDIYKSYQPDTKSRFQVVFERVGVNRSVSFSTQEERDAYWDRIRVFLGIRFPGCEKYSYREDVEVSRYND